MEKPLLLRACEAGAFGRMYDYDGGAIAEAGFIYLCGAPDEARLRESVDRWRNRMFVCRTAEWERALTALFPELKRHRRWQMRPLSAYVPDGLPDVPDGYAVRPFGEVEFAAHPFGHGALYRDWPHFSDEGSGAVAVCGEEIVASCSSFLTFSGEVELDISTKPGHRRRGLARACAAAMLRDCARRGLTVHWDAQNEASLRLARQLGFALDGAYDAYCFVSPENP